MSDAKVSEFKSLLRQTGLPCFPEEEFGLDFFHAEQRGVIVFNVIELDEDGIERGYMSVRLHSDGWVGSELVGWAQSA